MEITEALRADLALLTEALDDPGIDIVVTLRKLAADAGRAVRSFAGLTVIVRGDRLPFRLSTMPAVLDGSAPRASLLVSLAADGAPTGVDVVLYATGPGAFVDLAADVAWLTGRPLGDLVVDGHLDGHYVGRPTVASVLRDAAVIDQAIGVLIGRGHTPEQATRTLDERAAADGFDRLAAAAGVLDGLAGVELDGAAEPGDL